MRSGFLFQDDAVVGIKSALDYRYVKFMRVVLTFVKSWPAKEVGQHEYERLAKILRYLYFASTLLNLLGCIMYIIFHSSTLSFMEIGHQYIIMMMNVVDISRVGTLTLSAKYRRVSAEFLLKNHLFYYKDRSEFAMKTHKQVHTVSHLYTICLAAQMFSGLILFNLIPMYSNYTKGKYKRGGLGNSTFEQSLYFAYPFDVTKTVRGYITGFIIHWIDSFMVSIWFVMFDCFLSLMVFHIWGHYKILKDKLDNFPKPTSKSNTLIHNGMTIRCEMFSEEELKQISDTLMDCINYHRQIISFTDTLTDVFGPMLGVYYLYHQVASCLLLLECSAMTAQALIRYVPMTIISFQQLIQLSVIFELLGTASGKLKDAVYGLPWESMDLKNRKTVMFFLMNVQEPVHVKALGLADVGVTSMATILKTSLSYFTFLTSR